MRKNHYFNTGSGAMILVTIALIVSACGSGSGKEQAPIVRDTTITAQNAYNNLFFDSLRLEKAIAADSSLWQFDEKLRRFYAGRNYQFAWFDTSGMAEQAYNFRNLWTASASDLQDSLLLNVTLTATVDSLHQPGLTPPSSDSAIFRTEIALTRQFFLYAEKNFTGKENLDMAELEWFIPRKKIQAVELLDSLIATKGKDIARIAPVSKQYYLLEEYLKKYYQLEKETGWPEIVAEQKKFSPGDSSSTISAIKHRLSFLGDYADPDSSGYFNDALTEAVKNYQHRHGITEDGIIGAQFLRRLNAPINDRIRQILINMERLRWAPREPETDYLLVNIPEYRLHVYEDGQLSFDMDVVVGKAQHSTVIFTGSLKYIVFSPYWNIPPGILANEILPAVQRNPGYLAKHNMEVVSGKTVVPPGSINWGKYTARTFPYMIRQKPGDNNSLGRVKFLFPNNYNIYFHDTPAKSLFGESRRDFSHGCIRLSEPVKFAEHLLRNDTSWTPEKISEYMKADKEKYVTLKKEIPVFIGYFTAWVDKDGKLNFREDVYGHDKKLEEKLFGQQPE